MNTAVGQSSDHPIELLPFWSSPHTALLRRHRHVGLDLFLSRSFRIVTKMAPTATINVTGEFQVNKALRNFEEYANIVLPLETWRPCLGTLCCFYRLWEACNTNHRVLNRPIIPRALVTWVRVNSVGGQYCCCTGVYHDFSRKKSYKLLQFRKLDVITQAVRFNLSLYPASGIAYFFLDCSLAL